MDTWVLVLTLFSQSAVSLATVPGYSSEAECERTAVAFNSKTGGRISDDKVKASFEMRWTCLPGPRSSGQSIPSK
ncbi:protein of unknown function [Bradyrhizobium vignae]|uniref:Uncharacterized protein n=1 Tax=Bradyrhizobium vignae TaxID=1549949 RepID=A0A2U3PUB6_9BRAD|nr:protein of unknown function [Bradyrhizobium vignae]